MYNVALVLEYDSNLISLEQLRESRIIYYDNPEAMTLMKDGKVIIYTKKERNIFTLNLAQPGKAMARTDQRRPTYLINQNK